MPFGIKAAIRKIEVIAPYLIAIFFLLFLLIIRFTDSTWISGLTHNYLSVHIGLEFVGILVSFAVFTVGWATYQNAKDNDILVLSLASFAVGLLDLGHTLSFTGMPDFFGPSGPNKAINFWFASRIIGSLAFLYVAVSPPRQTRLRPLQWMLFILSATWVGFCSWFILFQSESLPVFFIPGKGLTPVKELIEWVLISISCSAGFLLFISAEKKANVSIRWMACASVLYGMCGYFFTVYKDFDDVYNFSGHVFKAVSYLVLYRAVFMECIAKPYERVQQLAAEAEASNLSKSRFLANVSHEFRTPLGVIGGFGDLLLSSGKLQQPEQTWAQTIVRNSKQLSLLIDDLLDLAKAETEKIEIRLSRFNLYLSAEQIKQALQMQAKTVDIKIENKLGNENFIVTDELRLRQILINMIGNAVKFTSKGHIKIILDRLSAETLEIRIEDTGIGIDPSDVMRLFQPFSQVSNPNNRRFGGTGLGLSLSRKLSQLLGGDLILKWSIPNVGSCFAFSFKDHSSEEGYLAAPPISKEAFLTAPSFIGKKVLIAEDSEDNQLLLQSYLGKTQIEITFAENGKIALEKISKGKFDVILMDIQMPQMDGFEATAKLRSQGYTGPILALTAHALQPERDRAMKNGFTDYLVKPIKKEALWKAISQSLYKLAP